MEGIVTVIVTVFVIVIVIVIIIVIVIAIAIVVIIPNAIVLSLLLYPPTSAGFSLGSLVVLLPFLRRYKVFDFPSKYFKAGEYFEFFLFGCFL